MGHRRGDEVENIIDAKQSVLVAQVRRAEASHKIDTLHNLLRGKHFTGPSGVVYLGDLAGALLAQLPHPETPVFSESPGFNEQRWTLETTSGDLSVTIVSRPYWAWGLLSSGYLNIITLEGPLEGRARLVLDTISALGQPPWEFAHQTSASRWMKRNASDINLKTNEQNWQNLHQAARETLLEAIENMREKTDAKLSATTDAQQAWRAAVEDDLHMARQALAEDNAPGVERALARLEATLIRMNVDPHENHVQAPETVISDGSDVMDLVLETSGGRTSLPDVYAEEDVPFVDLSNGSTSNEEE